MMLVAAKGMVSAAVAKRFCSSVINISRLSKICVAVGSNSMFDRST